MGSLQLECRALGMPPGLSPDRSLLIRVGQVQELGGTGEGTGQGTGTDHPPEKMTQASLDPR